MTNNDPKIDMYATTSQLAYNAKRECKYNKYNFPPRKAQKNAQHLKQVLASSSNYDNENDEIKSCLKQKTKDIFYESTTTAAQKYAKTQLLLKQQQEQPTNNNLAPHNVNDYHAITFWSQEKLKKDKKSNLPDSSSTNMMFARCSAFTNDIRDGKLRHSEATDEYISQIHS